MRRKKRKATWLEGYINKKKAIKTLTLWSLLPWAVCFVKHFFSQCQAGITKCDNQILIICMYRTNSWMVQIALFFVTLHESYYSDLNASLTFKAVRRIFAQWLHGPVLLPFKTRGILSPKGMIPDRRSQQQLLCKASLVEKWATLSDCSWPRSTTVMAPSKHLPRDTPRGAAPFQLEPGVSQPVWHGVGARLGSFSGAHFLQMEAKVQICWQWLCKMSAELTLLWPKVNWVILFNEVFLNFLYSSG